MASLAAVVMLGLPSQRIIVQRAKAESALKKANDALQASRTNLEQRVQERTAELLDSNSRLQEQIGRRQEAEEALLRSQRMEAMGQLTGGVAHEFNNLFMVIVGNIESAKESELGDDAQKWLSSALRGAMRGSELTNQLLAFSRKQDLKVEPMNLNSLASSMREMLRLTLGEMISVDTKLADDLWPVMADKTLLESALLNLSINARDAMPKGGKIVIATSNRVVDTHLLNEHPNRAPGDYVMLEVADTGSGVAPENLERVFEPFFTTKEVGEGTGLGLSMVHGFIEQSGGFVDIESQLDQGTKVRIYLPRTEDAVVALRPDQKLGAKVPSIVATVLVVEDDPEVRQIVVRKLSELGCNIIEAKDGVVALSLMAKHPEIDVLFTDVVLPEGLSGPDIAIEALSINPGLKVIFTSGYPEGEINNLGYDDQKPWLIRKPYTKSELADLFTKVLQS